MGKYKAIDFDHMGGLSPRLLAAGFEPESDGDLTIIVPELSDDELKELIERPDTGEEIAAHRALMISRVRTFASEARAQLAGTADPVKIGTYAQRAAFARHIVAGTASDAMVAVAKSEAVRLELAADIDSADAEAMAQIWIEKDERLAGLAAEMDKTESGIIAVINGSETIAAIDATIEGALAAAQARVAQVLA